MRIQNCIYSSQWFHAEQVKTVYHYQFKHFSKNDVIFILCTSRMKVWVCRMNEKDGWDILVLERLEYFIYTLWRIPVV